VKHVERTVQIEGVERGSGYAVASDLVLTAGHVVGRRGDRCRITLARDMAGVAAGSVPTHDGLVVWRAEEADAALVRSPVALWPDQLTTIYGELRGIKDVKCVTVGYPVARIDAEGRRRMEEHAWKVMPSTGMEDGRYALNTDLVAPQASRRRSPWAGQSGAAVLYADDPSVVLGTVVASPDAFPPGRLEAVRVTALLEDPGFARLVGATREQVVAVPRQRSPLAWSAAVIAVPVLVAAAVWQLWPDGEGDASQATPNGEPPGDTAEPGLVTEDFTLRPSYFWTTADIDKLDIDTGEPGHGSQVQIPGNENPGGLAELILEPERLHTPDDEPRYLRVPDGTAVDPAACEARIASDADGMVGTIELTELAQGHTLCVRTDEGLTAVVEVVEHDIGRLLTINVTTPASAATP
jgi:hypothetical protein